jgi:ketosteroid isomerase-like protein
MRAHLAALALAPILTLAAGPAVAGACDTARAYLLHVQARDVAGLVNLFAEDADFRTPYGHVLKGRADIRQFYAPLLAASATGVRITTYYESGDTCTFELEAQSKRNEAGDFVPDATGAWIPTSVDIFAVDKRGRITSMVAYPAPRSRWQDGKQGMAAPGKLP